MLMINCVSRGINDHVVSRGIASRSLSRGDANERAFERTRLYRRIPSVSIDVYACTVHLGYLRMPYYAYVYTMH